MVYIAGVLVKQDDKYLLVQEKKPHVYGLWNLPAGHVDEGETFQQAAKREGKEETGLDLQVGRELLVFTGDTGNHQVHIFESYVTGGKITWNKEDLLDVKWFTKEEIKYLKLRSEKYHKLFE